MNGGFWGLAALGIHARRYRGGADTGRRRTGRGGPSDEDTGSYRGRVQAGGSGGAQGQVQGALRVGRRVRVQGARTAKNRGVHQVTIENYNLGSLSRELAVSENAYGCTCLLYLLELK